MGKSGFLVILAVALVAALWLDRPDDDWDGRLPPERPDDAAAYRSVQEEAEALGPSQPWAGIYSSGPGLSGSTLYLLPSGRYCVHEWADIGEGRSACGRLVERPDRFVSESKAPWESYDKDGPAYLKVRWGSRHYLVPVRRALEFVNAVNAGFEPRQTDGLGFGGYLRHGEEALAAPGEPDLPRPQLGLLRPAPVTVRVDKPGFTRGALYSLASKWLEPIETDCRVDFALDAGSSAGVFVGMRLYPLPPGRGPSATVVSAEAGSAVARAVKYDCWGADPRRGDAYSTRPKN